MSCRDETYRKSTTANNKRSRKSADISLHRITAQTPKNGKILLEIARQVLYNLQKIEGFAMAQQKVQDEILRAMTPHQKLQAAMNLYYSAR